MSASPFLFRHNKYYVHSAMFPMCPSRRRFRIPDSRFSCGATRTSRDMVPSGLFAYATRSFRGAMNSPNWKAIREQFPALHENVFLDAACVSLAPPAATDAIAAFLEMALHCPEPSATHHHIAMDEMRNAARSPASRLLNASED